MLRTTAKNVAEIGEDDGAAIWETALPFLLVDEDDDVAAPVPTITEELRACCSGDERGGRLLQPPFLDIDGGGAPETAALLVRILAVIVFEYRYKLQRAPAWNLVCRVCPCAR